jgi:hypothetical protein
MIELHESGPHDKIGDMLTEGGQFGKNQRSTHTRLELDLAECSLQCFSNQSQTAVVIDAIGTCIV